MDVSGSRNITAFGKPAELVAATPINAALKITWLNKMLRMF
jgi:hypothetical protein